MGVGGCGVGVGATRSVGQAVGVSGETVAGPLTVADGGLVAVPAEFGSTDDGGASPQALTPTVRQTITLAARRGQHPAL
jgi:hypothetical protein